MKVWLWRGPALEAGPRNASFHTYQKYDPQCPARFPSQFAKHSHFWTFKSNSTFLNHPQSDPPQGDTHITLPSIIMTSSLRLHHLINSSWAVGPSAFIFIHAEERQNWRTVCVIICFLSKVSTATPRESPLVTLSTPCDGSASPFYTIFQPKTLTPILSEWKKRRRTMKSNCWDKEKVWSEKKKKKTLLKLFHLG